MTSHTKASPAGDNSAPPSRARLWRYFRRYLAWFAGGGLFLLLTNLLGLQIPAYIGDSVELLRGALTDGDDLAAAQSKLVDAGIAIILLAIGAGIARVFSRVLIFNAGRYIEFDVRNELYAKLSTLDAGFFGSMATGDITSRSANDVSYIRLLFAISFLHIINTSVAYAIAIGRMVELNWHLTVISLLPYPLFLFGLRFVLRALFDQTKIVQSQLSGLSSKVQENLSGFTVVKAYTIEDREIARFRTLNESFFQKSMRLAVIRGGMQTITTTLAGVGTFMVLVVGTGLVIDQSMTLGEFVEFNSYVVALAFPTIAMGWVFSVWHRGLAAFDRVAEILDAEPAIKPPDDPRSLPPIGHGVARGGVDLDGVSFRYADGDDLVLDDIDLHIAPGSTIGIVGRTGSGKTTLVKLIARLYDPTHGRVRVDGVDLRDLAPRQLRAEIGFVPQDPFLFSMTVGQNVRFGLDSLEFDDSLDRPEPSRPLRADDPRPSISQDERIQQAVAVAGLEPDLDSFSDGLDTLVGERGVTLSGGQKQRVTIARALLVDPRILILDDALSSVDTRTEEVILDHLDAIMKDRTSIILTHRFNCLARVDEIFVLDHGRIIERGTHEELLALNGAYRRMVDRQALEDSLEQE